VNFPLFVARRYFLSRRKKNFINIISILSMVALALATAALIIVLSVFNGLEGLLRSLNSRFDPELKIAPAKGKSFPVTDSLRQQLSHVPGVKIVTEVIEDYAYVRYRGADMVATLKGVSQNFIDQHRLDEAIQQGDLWLTKDSVEYAVIGQGVQYALSLPLADDFNPLQVFYIKNQKSRSANPADLYFQQNLRVSGVFSIEKNIDENYILVPLAFAERLLNYANRRTSLEVMTDGQTAAVKQRLEKRLGPGFVVLTNEEQHKDLYRLLKIEKLFAFVSFALLLLISSINIFFSLMMLVIDKKRDVAILFAMGARDTTIRAVFVHQGALIAFIGAGAGLVLGTVVCLLQQHVGLVGMGMENAIVTNYPVAMKASDFALTVTTQIAITLTISFYPASVAARSYRPDAH
jgi:lipoprotein-releasing system permease protein